MYYFLSYNWQNFFISAEECYKSPLEWRIWVECNGNCLVVSFWVGLWSTSLYGKASMPLERFELLTVWKNEKFTLTCEIFREMSVKCNLVQYWNALISQKFCLKMVRVNFRNFHSVLLGPLILSKATCPRIHCDLFYSLTDHLVHCIISLLCDEHFVLQSHHFGGSQHRTDSLHNSKLG